MIGQTSLLPEIVDQDQAVQSLRSLLRQTTQDVHDRLHKHAGFAAVQDNTITLSDYQRLLVRLYGFYVPFEAAAALTPERSTWLECDLRATGSEGALSVLPLCQDIPSLDRPHLRLGARYVVEGSALGGRDLARGLDHLLGKDEIKGREFFTGRGTGTGQAWSSYLAELSRAPLDPLAQTEIIKGAVETFASFEKWLSGWSTLSYG